MHRGYSTTRSASAGAATALLLIVMACPAVGDGVFVPTQAMGDAGRPSSAAQRAVIVREGADEVLLLQTTYQGPASEFAWVVPVPRVPSDVFEAEARFIDEVFLHTNPRVITDIEPVREPRGRAGASKGVATEDAPLGAPSEAPAVTVHSRREVGQYDASVLSATGEKALVKWLTDNGYAVVEEVGSSLKPYVDKGFAFVAVRLLPGAAERTPTVMEVSPLGIRFEVEKLFYPLEVSRGSAPELTSLLLCLIDDAPVDCDTIATTWLSGKPTMLGRGSTYGTFRRQATRTGGPALLCEYSAAGALPYDDLSYRADEWSDADLRTGLSERHATRFYGLLARTEMVDLEFSPAPGRPTDYHVLVDRKGRASAEAAAALRENMPQVLRRVAGSGAVIPVSLTLPAESARPAAAKPATEGAARSSRRGAWVPWVACGTVLVAAVLLIVLARRRGMVATLLVVCLVTAAVGVSRAGVGTSAVDPALTVVDLAFQAFVADMGAYPTNLEALTAATAPTGGLDASGNRVPLAGKWQGPYLTHLPMDPLGANLAYDPLNLRPVDSGGYTIKVSSADTHQIEQRWTEVRGGSRPAEAPRNVKFWSRPGDDARAQHEAYSAWLADRSSAELLVGCATSVGSSSDIGPALPSEDATIVADPGRGEFHEFARTSDCVDPRTGADWLVWPLRYGSATALFLTSDSGVLQPITARPVKVPTGRLVLAPDGRTAAILARGTMDSALWILRPDRGFERLADGGRFYEAAFSPAGDAVYVLGWLADAYDKASREYRERRPTISMHYVDGTEAALDLIRFPLDGGEPAVIRSGLLPQVLSVSEPGILVSDRPDRLLLIPHDGGEPSAIELPDGQCAPRARLFPSAVVYLSLATSVVEPHGATPGGMPWLSYVCVARLPLGQEEPAVLAKGRWTAASGIIILGWDGSAVTFAETAYTTSRPRLEVKRVSTTGEETVLRDVTHRVAER